MFIFESFAMGGLDLYFPDMDMTSSSQFTNSVYFN